MIFLLLAAEPSSGIDVGPWAQLGAVGVVLAVFFYFIWNVIADLRKQRDDAQAKNDKIHDTLAPVLERVVKTMQDDRDLILTLNARLAEREAHQREQR